MLKILKRFLLPRFWKQLIFTLRLFPSIGEIIDQHSKSLNVLEKSRRQFLGVMIRQQYPELVVKGFGDSKSQDWSVFSQNNEDGRILDYFSKIGATNHIFVEVGSSGGQECNTANLSLNFGWSGLLIDGDKDAIEQGRKFYRQELGQLAESVVMVNEFVTAENINKIIMENGIEGQIDLLSIDIDGNDYWIWEAIDAVDPRLVLVEYNSIFGLRPVTIPYQASFQWKVGYHPYYYGASLTAFTNLANRKGYVLVGVESGLNAFYVKEYIARERSLNSVEAEDVFAHQRKWMKHGDPDCLFQKIGNLPFVEIE